MSGMKMGQMSRHRKDFVSGSVEDTLCIASELAKGFRGDEVVFLFGELGTGKTVFAKGIASGLGVRDIRQVCSPSYTLMNIYQAKYTIYHIDLYRLQSEAEILDLGWEDFLGCGIVIVEWAEKMTILPESIRVTLQVLEGEKRRICIDLPIL
jgi:tRNA threonylcarbamoyladenosine biosynthesis protein TsaE